MLNRKGPESLADFIHAWTYDERPAFKELFSLKGDWPKMEKRCKQNLRETIRRAERFVLSDDFLRRAVVRGSGNVSQTLANADLARMPFDTLLVEYDDNVKHETQVGLGSTINTPVEGDMGRGGFLFTRWSTGWQATHLSSSEGSMPVWPINCVLQSPGDAMVDQLVDGRHPLGQQILASGWGYMAQTNDNNQLGFAMYRQLMARGFAFLEPFLMLPLQRVAINMRNKGNHALNGAIMTYAPAWARENCGSLRLATAILASLNTVPTQRVHRTATGSFQHRLRNIPRLSVTNVSIDAKPGHEAAVYDRAFREEASRHNRRHEVRGHWRDIERHGALVGCAHEPGLVEGDYALCTKCTHLLRWIEHHERGDEKLGWVFHGEYNVK